MQILAMTNQANFTLAIVIARSEATKQNKRSGGVRSTTGLDEP
ncbi:hypothetical protein OFN91_04645 [Campylobacter sp. JMF_08 NE1]|nr:hypothetical protein [Campylobacter sp. JMF_08 NE1]